MTGLCAVCGLPDDPSHEDAQTNGPQPEHDYVDEDDAG